jgi:predicted small metal-binding protein
MMPMKTIVVHQYIRVCPDCGWEPGGVEESANLGELTDHVKKLHEMGEPRTVVRRIRLAGGFQACDVAVFGNQSYWRWIDGLPKPAWPED